MNPSVHDNDLPPSVVAESVIQRGLGLSASPNPVAFTSLTVARTCYGQSTIVWASLKHQVEDDWWMGLSGTPYVDFNVALLHGESSLEVVPHVLDEIREAGIPALIMLAGAGLGAGHLLTEAGWKCIDSKPFMAKRGGSAQDDPNVRELEQHELARARHLSADAFGVPEEVVALVYADDHVRLQGCNTWGLFDRDEIMSCLLTMSVGEYSVGWALSTAAQNQRAGYGRRMVRAIGFKRLSEGPPVGLLMATNAGKRLYEQEGYVTLEHWQIWSRPRWVLR